ncbi:MAG: hypothetical protein CMN87_12055 [Stappia sp.]|uniref:hypothetical protein n=1 Tax=Stappia sp. TaxID=1870903 RepID=UPI000C5D0859|nr:hypothetical protein [Stappia sp.]MBM20734.1 hypothetical protein [Stappia sp.]
MATEAEILTKLNDLLDGIDSVLDGAGASKLVPLDRATPADAALVYLRENGDERFRWGMPGGEDDFVIQHSPDGSPLTYSDVLRIDSETGKVTVTGLAIEGASFADTSFTGQSLFADGSAAAPSIANDGDTNTGLFFPAADQIAAVTGGEVRWLADANGRVGVGTGLDTPRRRLHVRQGSAVGGSEDVNTVALIEHGDSNAALYIKTLSNKLGAIMFGHESEINKGQIRYDHNSNYMSFWTDSFERVRVDSLGRVGIGTTVPGYILDVFENKDALSLIRFRNAATGASARSRLQLSTGTGNSYLNLDLADGNGSPYLTLAAGPALTAAYLDLPDFRFRPGGTEIARITSAGLAVGSTGGDYGVTWRGVFRHDYDGSTDVGIINSVSGSAAAVRHRMIGGTGNSSRVEILADNNGSPYFTYLYGSAVESVRWVSGATEFMRYVASTGNLGVGTPSPTEKIDINSDAIRVRGTRTPASASAPGEVGTVCWDASYVYVCTATDTWVRAALSTW